MTSSVSTRRDARWGVLAAVAIAQLMVVLDATVMNIALPAAQSDLGFSDVGRQWVISAYGLAFGALLLVGGRVNDWWGRRRSFLVGLVGFGAASVLGGAAPTIEVLVAARAVQGVFAALLAPAALSLLTLTFPSGPDRARAFGVYGALGGSGGAIGLLLGGALTQYAGWRWTLLINIAFAVAAFWLGARAIVDAPAQHRTRIDIAGAVLVTIGLGSLVMSLSAAEGSGWAAPSTVILLLLAIVLLVTFVVVESRVKAPLLPLRVILERNRGGAYLSYGLAIVAQLGMFLLLSYYFQRELDFTPLAAGLAFMPLTIALLIGSTQVAPRLMERVNARVLIGGGFLLAAIGLFLLTFITPDLSSFWTLVLPGTVLLGFGSGVAIMRAQTVATGGVEPRDAGVASAMVNVSAQVGTALGTALLSTIATLAAASLPATTAPTAASMHGYIVAFAVAASIMFVAAAIGATVVHIPARAEEPAPAAV